MAKSQLGSKLNLYNASNYGSNRSRSNKSGDGIINEAKSEEEGTALWDSIWNSPEPKESGSMVEKHGYEVMLRILKITVYIVLFSLILGGVIVAKGSILFATSQLSGKPVPFCGLGDSGVKVESRLGKEAQPPWIWVLIICFSIPELLDFASFLWNLFFVDFRLPKLSYFGLLNLVEILHVVGLALLFLVVLPDLDVLQGIAALSCIGLVPSVLGALSRHKLRDENPMNPGDDLKSNDSARLNGLTRRRKNNEESLICAIGDPVAVLLQIFSIAVVGFIASENSDAFAPWTAPIALVLSSLRWWGNYVSSNSAFGFMRYLAKARNVLHTYRSVLLGYTSLLRILTMVLSAMLISSWKEIGPKEFFNGFRMREYNFIVEKVGETESVEVRGNRWIPLYVIIIHASAAICVYSCAKFSCKTLMQRMGFAAPLFVSLPCSLASLGLLVHLRELDECAFHDLLPDHLFFAAPPKLLDQLNNWCNWHWLLGFASMLWLTRHAWTSTNERLANCEKIFAVTSYDSLVLDQALALARWRDRPDDPDFDRPVDVEEQSLNFKRLTSIKQQDRVTKIYVCATMWHETPEEMMDFLSSILRLDRDQSIMRIIQRFFDVTTPDYYEIEVHIFFDDAFKCVHGCSSRCSHDEDMTQVNDWVVNFISAVEKSIVGWNLPPPAPPTKFPAPYGGRLLWTLPELTKMYVHLKDKNRIRTRKRWSQVMYMYYLLGYRLLTLPINETRKEVIAENTYILTLDGDIDFRPSAVRALVDRMKANKDLGSVCGRIHPLGSGPLVWIQKFEYAVGNWLQKATEHVIGSVLCSPGCFALFRAKALMDGVMRTYASVPTEAQHYIQYDQGEDRWLCTLVLQKGYKVEYSAASDAYTHAPETFNDFYIQRRRWIPSTVANIFDLLGTAKRTRKQNRDISRIYIFYQWILMGSTILGPGTIFIMLVGSFVAAFDIDNWTSFTYNLIPIVIFSLVCYFCKEKTQLMVAAVISAIYALVMVVVLVGVIIQMSEDGLLAPSSILFVMFVGGFLITGLLHPLEWDCLVCGIIYYITVPSMYLLLIIFSVFNMNNVTWGTRDIPKPPPTEEKQVVEQNTQPQKKEATSSEKGPVEFSVLGLFKCTLFAREKPDQRDVQLREISQALAQIQSRLDHVDRCSENATRSDSEPKVSDMMSTTTDGGHPSENPSVAPSVTFAKELEEDCSDSSDSSDSFTSVYEATSAKANSFLVSPNWLRDEQIGKGDVEYLDDEEETFWKQFIGAYLRPIDKDPKQEAEIAEKIKDLRNQHLFKFFMINALFVLIIFLMQLKKNTVNIPWPIGTSFNITYYRDREEVHIDRKDLRLEPVGCLFVIGFIGLLLIQFVAMLFHRFETFSHIMANTTLEFAWFNKDLSDEARVERLVVKFMKEFQRGIDDNDAKDRQEDAERFSSPKVSENFTPPRKRKVIHKIMNRTKDKSPYTQTFSSQLQRILDESDLGGDDRVTRRMPKNELQDLRERRKTVLMKLHELPIGKNDTDSLYENPNNEEGFTRVHVDKNSRTVTYDNAGFVPD